MKTILLYGELAEAFGREHRFSVRNVSEAIRALRANFRGFSDRLCGAHLRGVGFRVMVGDYSLESVDETVNPSSDRDVIRIIPVMIGSGGGFFKVLLGVALIVGGIIVSAASFGAAGPLGSAMISTGAGLVIGGVAQLLTKPPEAPESTEADRKPSYIFNGPTNTTAQGGPVPVGYGRMIVGSVTISAGIETHETT